MLPAFPMLFSSFLKSPTPGGLGRAGHSQLLFTELLFFLKETSTPRVCGEKLETATQMLNQNPEGKEKSLQRAIFRKSHDFFKQSHRWEPEA